MKNSDKPTDKQVKSNIDLNKKPDDHEVQRHAQQGFAQHNPQWEPSDTQSSTKGYEEEGV